MFDSYELTPKDNRKSFYGKARVILAGPLQILRSYETFVAYIDDAGKVHKTWDGWSATTGRHIKTFCGLNKSAWDRLPLEPAPEV